MADPTRFGPRSAIEQVVGYLLVAPVLLWLVATIGLPLADVLHLSLENVRVVGGPASFVVASPREVVRFEC
jgi:multiple sugar transport system permease protein